jgi:hypothetical protein
MNNHRDDQEHTVNTSQDANRDLSLDINSFEAADDERDTIQRMLDVLAREHAEPRDGFEPVPFGVAAIFGALLAWGGYYLSLIHI